jgi:hypothetical protein
MNRFMSWILLFIAFGSLGRVVYHALGVRLRAGKGMPEYSLLGEDYNGLSAAGALLRKLNWQPVALTRPIQHSEQRESKGCLLMLVEPADPSWFSAAESTMNKLAVKGMLHWVERGNTLFLCGRRVTPLHGELDLFVKNDARVPEDVTSDAAVSEAGGYTEGLSKIVVEGHDVLGGARNALPLWWLDNQPGAVLVPRGKGRIIMAADPSLLTLRGLKRGDNLRFLVNLAALHAGDGHVYFDEYHHGLRTGGGFWGYVHYHGQQWILPALGAVLAIAAWGVGLRLGRPVKIPEEKRADAVDYASALARIYERTGAQRMIAATLCRDFLAILTRQLRLPGTSLPAEILAAWRRRNPGRDSQELEALLRGVTALRSHTVAPGPLLTLTKNLDRFKTEVLRAG